MDPPQGLEQPHDQAGQGGFAAAVFAGDQQHGTRLQGEKDRLEQGRRPPGIAEGQVLEFDPALKPGQGDALFRFLGDAQHLFEQLVALPALGEGAVQLAEAGHHGQGPAGEDIGADEASDVQLALNDLHGAGAHDDHGHHAGTELGDVLKKQLTVGEGVPGPTGDSGAFRPAFHQQGGGVEGPHGVGFQGGVPHRRLGLCGLQGKLNVAPQAKATEEDPDQGAGADQQGQQAQQGTEKKDRADKQQGEGDVHQGQQIVGGVGLKILFQQAAQGRSHLGGQLVRRRGAGVEPAMKQGPGQLFFRMDHQGHGQAVADFAETVLQQQGQRQAGGQGGEGGGDAMDQETPIDGHHVDGTGQAQTVDQKGGNEDLSADQRFGPEIAPEDAHRGTGRSNGWSLKPSGSSGSGMSMDRARRCRPSRSLAWSRACRASSVLFKAISTRARF